MENFPQQLDVMRQRVQALYRRGGEPFQHDPVTSAAFEELANAVEELRAIEDEHHQQYETWQNERMALESEIQRYRELFAYAPVGYIVTSLNGTIRQANAAAEELLQTNERFLIGRSLALFVPEGQRRLFRSAVANLADTQQAHEWELQLQAWNGTPFEAEATITVVRGPGGRAVALHWLIRDISRRLQTTERGTRDVASGQYVGQTEPVDRAVPLERLCAFLAEASVLLAVAHDVEASLAHVAHLAVPAIAEGCLIELADTKGAWRRLVITGAEGTDDQRTHATWQRAPAHTSALHTLSQVANDQQICAPTLIEAALADDARAITLQTTFGTTAPVSAIVVPLRAHEQVRGIFALVSTASRRQYSRSDLALTEELARRMAAVIERRPHLHS
jgi:PAS domain S-box-containing protein